MKKVPISFCLRFWSRLFLLQMFLVSVAPANNDQSVVWLLHRMCRDQRAHGLDVVVVKLFLEVQQLPLPQEGEIGGVAEHPPRVRHNHNCLKYTHVMASILSYCREAFWCTKKFYKTSFTCNTQKFCQVHSVTNIPYHSSCSIKNQGCYFPHASYVFWGLISD